MNLSVNVSTAAFFILVNSGDLSCLFLTFLIAFSTKVNGSFSSSSSDGSCFLYLDCFLDDSSSSSDGSCFLDLDCFSFFPDDSCVASDSSLTEESFCFFPVFFST